MNVNIDKNNKIKFINKDNDLGSNRVSFKQNSSGFWYTNELTINCISIIDGIALAKTSINKVNEMLKEVNAIKKLKPIG